jgi:hypothetical protein
MLSHLNFVRRTNSDNLQSLQPNGGGTRVSLTEHQFMFGQQINSVITDRPKLGIVAPGAGLPHVPNQMSSKRSQVETGRRRRR